MEKKSLTAMDEYINKVYTIALLILPTACLCAGLLYTIEKALGLLPTVLWPALVIFDLTCVTYLAIGYYLVKTGIRDGLVLPEKLQAGKIYIVLVLTIQFNFILYMIPLTDFWGFAFFFLLFASLFLDTKMVAITDLLIAVSLFLSWFIHSDVLLPTRDAFFVPNLIDRIVCTVLSLPMLWFFVFLVRFYLVNAKKEELEKNNERVATLLSHVTKITHDLGEASTKLVDSSQTESASTEELSAISETLLRSSTEMSDMAEQSKENLTRLSNTSESVTGEMQNVDRISRDLVELSRTNEHSLNHLTEISAEVEQSTEKTREVTAKLVEESEEIGKTLDIINSIAGSISLLALNASIEAARAGEAGRGFAVVAQEVGNLAAGTKETLETVNDIVTRVQNGTNDVSTIINANADQLLKQGEVISETVEGIRRMMTLLKQSVEAIESTDVIQQEQSQIIGETVSINEKLANGIQEENNEFANIADMVQSNSDQILVITSQIDAINSMIGELESLLE